MKHIDLVKETNFMKKLWDSQGFRSGPIIVAVCCTACIIHAIKILRLKTAIEMVLVLDHNLCDPYFVHEIEYTLPLSLKDVIFLQ